NQCQLSSCRLELGNGGREYVCPVRPKRDSRQRNHRDHQQTTDNFHPRLQAFKVSNFTLARLQLSDTAIKKTTFDGGCHQKQCYVEKPRKTQRHKEGTQITILERPFFVSLCLSWFLTYPRSDYSLVNLTPSFNSFSYRLGSIL